MRSEWYRCSFVGFYTAIVVSLLKIHVGNTEGLKYYRGSWRSLVYFGAQRQKKGYLEHETDTN